MALRCQLAACAAVSGRESPSIRSPLPANDRVLRLFRENTLSRRPRECIDITPVPRNLAGCWEVMLNGGGADVCRRRRHLSRPSTRRRSTRQQSRNARRHIWHCTPRLLRRPCKRRPRQNGGERPDHRREANEAPTMRAWLPILGRRPPSFNFELLCAA